MPEKFIHIPVVGDHYSPVNGSSYPTIIYQWTRCHEVAGGKTIVIVGKGTMEGYPPYELGRCVEVDFGAFPHRRSVRMMDAVAGAAGLRRPVKWRAYRAMLDAIDRDFDGFVFVHGEPAVIVPLKKARPKAKVVLYCHYDLFQWYREPEVNAVAAACHRVLCNSQYIGNYVNRKAGRELGNLRVAYYGIDVEGFTPAESPPTGRPVVMFFGRVAHQKGVDLLIEAAKIVKGRGVDFTLRVVGGTWLGPGVPQLTPYEQELRELAKPLGSDAVFDPPVSRSAIAAEIRKSAVVCVPSRWDEPFGMVVLEALACGVPTIASNRGGIPEAAGDAAIYFDPSDVQALAGHLERLLRDPAERARLGAAGRKRAEESTWERRYPLLIEALTQ